MSKRGQNEGTIHKREDGRWCAAVSLGYVGGRLKRKALYGKTRAEVSEKLKKALRDVQQGLPVSDDRVTLQEYLTRWLGHIAGSVRPRTLENYRFIVDRHIVPALGKVKLARLSPAQVQQFLTDAASKGKLTRAKEATESAKKLSPRTVQLMLAVLRKALGQAEKWGLVQRNVAKLVDPPKLERAKMHPFTLDEAKAVLAAARGNRLEALYSVALALGLREGEVLALQWSDVDLEASVLHVRHTLQRLNRQWLLMPPKSSTSRRTIVLPPTLRDALRRHRTRQLEERLAAGELWQSSLDADLVFTTETGAPIHQRYLLDRYHALLATAEVPKRRFHDARHGAASILLAQGIQPKVIQEILGHSEIRVTMDLYAHVYLEALQGAATAMESAMFAPAAGGK